MSASLLWRIQLMIPTLLFLAPPASGKSEARTFLLSLDPERLESDFHLGPMIQLDDYFYVAFMRAVDKVAVERLHMTPIFFTGPDGQFQDPYEWGTLAQLLNADYDELLCPWHEPEDLALWLFKRIDAAEQRAGGKFKFMRLPGDVLRTLASLLQEEAQKVTRYLQETRTTSLEGKTVVLEAARGGPDGASMPLNPPHGYNWFLRQLNPQILDGAVILYVAVSPQESRKRNFARALPPPGQEANEIYFHGVPTTVMLGDYGCDDMAYLRGRHSVVTLWVHGKEFRIPVVWFDNEVDKTSFMRSTPQDPDQRAKLEAALLQAFQGCALT